MGRTNVLSGFLRKLSSPVNKAKSSTTLREDADDQNLSFDLYRMACFAFDTFRTLLEHHRASLMLLIRAMSQRSSLSAERRHSEMFSTLKADLLNQ